jgi:hypothetical protein
VLGEKAGLFAANPRAFRFRSGRCGFSAAIPAREERAENWLWWQLFAIRWNLKNAKTIIQFLKHLFVQIGNYC